MLTVETSTKPSLKDKEWHIALAREEGEGEAKCRIESPGPISCLCLPPPSHEELEEREPTLAPAPMCHFW